MYVSVSQDLVRAARGSKCCAQCQKKFDTFSREHICKRCLKPVCSNCSPDKMIIIDYDQRPKEKHRVCRYCFLEGSFQYTLLSENSLEFGKTSQIGVRWLRSLQLISSDDSKVGEEIGEIESKYQSSTPRDLIQTIDLTKMKRLLSYSLKEWVFRVQGTEKDEDISKKLVSILNRLAAILNWKTLPNKFHITALFFLSFSSEAVTFAILLQIYQKMLPEYVTEFLTDPPAISDNILTQKQASKVNELTSSLHLNDPEDIPSIKQFISFYGLELLSSLYIDILPVQSFFQVVDSMIILNSFLEVESHFKLLVMFHMKFVKNCQIPTKETYQHVLLYLCRNTSFNEIREKLNAAPSLGTSFAFLDKNTQNSQTSTIRHSSHVAGESYPHLLALPDLPKVKKSNSQTDSASKPAQQQNLQQERIIPLSKSHTLQHHQLQQQKQNNLQSSYSNSSSNTAIDDSIQSLTPLPNSQLECLQTTVINEARQISSEQIIASPERVNNNSLNEVIDEPTSPDSPLPSVLISVSSLIQPIKDPEFSEISFELQREIKDLKQNLESKVEVIAEQKSEINSLKITIQTLKESNTQSQEVIQNLNQDRISQQKTIDRLLIEINEEKERNKSKSNEEPFIELIPKLWKELHDMQLNLKTQKQQALQNDQQYQQQIDELKKIQIKETHQLNQLNENLQLQLSEKESLINDKENLQRQTELKFNQQINELNKQILIISSNFDSQLVQIDGLKQKQKLSDERFEQDKLDLEKAIVQLRQEPQELRDKHILLVSEHSQEMESVILRDTLIFEELKRMNILLQGEIEQLKKKNEELVKLKQEQECQIFSLKDSHTQLEGIQAEVIQKNSQIETLQKAINADKTSELEQLTQSLNEQIQLLQKSHSEVESISKESIAQEKQKQSEMSIQILKLSSEIETLKEEKVTATKSASANTDLLDVLKKEIKELKEQLTVKEGQLVATQQELNKYLSVFESVKKTVTEGES